MLTSAKNRNLVRVDLSWPMATLCGALLLSLPILAAEAQTSGNQSCVDKSLTAARLLEALHDIAMHGDLSDIDHVQKTLQTRFESAPKAPGTQLDYRSASIFGTASGAGIYGAANPASGEKHLTLQMTLHDPCFTFNADALRAVFPRSEGWSEMFVVNPAPAPGSTGEPIADYTEDITRNRNSIRVSFGVWLRSRDFSGVASIRQDSALVATPNVVR